MVFEEVLIWVETNNIDLNNKVLLWLFAGNCATGVTLKSDPAEKWLPGSFFNVQNDSPGHFSTLKAETVQILTLNYEPKVVKKWLPPWTFDFKGVIFQRFIHIENKFVYPHQRSFRGILVSPRLFVCLSVCLSVCPSVKKLFLYNSSSSIWHTMMILHIYYSIDLRRTSVDCGSKGQKVKFRLIIFVFYKLDATRLRWVV